MVQNYGSDEMGRPIMWLFSIQIWRVAAGAVLVYGFSFNDGLQGLGAGSVSIYSDV
ncbi:hypothetical protein BJ878DRAFT_520822 [Calycina marina]|uniref:Uncharacterized protein n=1 Tax=Calycina marina TaxID=1763456 RepID=A0A9P7YY66_9HELO|nr:hypothetical protein BJ878DRAFT_520822 [Calycina marina]